MKDCFIWSSILLLTLIGLGESRAQGVGEDRAYSSLRKAVLNGKSINLIFNLAACHVHGSNHPGPAITGSLRLDGFMLEADQTIAFSATHFTLKGDDTPMMESLGFRVQPSGDVVERSRFLDAKTYQVIHDARFDCSLGKGISFHW